jgi:N6-adenosine-specific RNA methylase IME4
VPKLEIFSRLKRPGWEVFGNQVEYDLLSGEDLYGQNAELSHEEGEIKP